MSEDEVTLKVNVEVTGPDFIITTPAQLAQAMAVYYKRWHESPYEFVEYSDDFEADGKASAEYIISILRELNDGTQQPV